MFRCAVVCVLAVALCGVASAADLSGSVFRDRNGNGVQDPGEEGLPATIELFGQSDAGGALDLNAATATDGTFFIGPGDVADGCYVTRITPPRNFRQGPVRQDCPGSGLGHPVGTRRYRSPKWLIDRLRAGSLLHITLGDSIAEPVSECTIFPDRLATDYVGRFGDRLTCVAGGSGVINDNEAIGGKLTEHLLEQVCGQPIIPILTDLDDRCDNIYDTIARNPELVSISIGGNDWLGSEPDPPDQVYPFPPIAEQRSIEALISARSNLQAILAALATELPNTDVIVNTVHDNLAGGCASTDFHNAWTPIWMTMIRDLVWAHGERFSIAEISPEYAHQDILGNNCCGEQGLICRDEVHPDRAGAEVHLEKVWDAAGGVNLGLKDGIDAMSIPDLLFPAVELLAVRFPEVSDDRASTATSPELALRIDGRSASIPAGGGEFQVSGFDAIPTGVTPTKVVVVVRYRTTGAAVDEADEQIFEASIDGSFASPRFSVTGWNTVIPIVGTGVSAKVANALPNVPQYREVRAALNRNVLDDGRVTGSYVFPDMTWLDLETLTVRFRGSPRGGVDVSSTIEWDAAWVEVYGVREPGTLDVYRSPVAANLVDPANQIGSAGVGPYEDLPPTGSLHYYAVDDGTGLPGTIFLTREPGAVRLAW